MKKNLYPVLLLLCLATNLNAQVKIGSPGTPNTNTAQKAAGYRVNVAGKIVAEEVRVQLRAAWPDYVFDDQYKKLSLYELEKYVAVNKHLLNIPSAADIEKDGQ